MANLNISNANNIDITARSLDNFDLTVTIQNADGTIPYFHSDEILLFTVMTNDYKPVLIACNHVLQMNPQAMPGIPIWQGGNPDTGTAVYFTIPPAQNTVNAIKTRTIGVANYLAGLSGNTTYQEELLNYSTQQAYFSKSTENVGDNPYLNVGPNNFEDEYTYLSLFYGKPVPRGRASSGIAGDYIATETAGSTNNLGIAIDNIGATGLSQVVQTVNGNTVSTLYPDTGIVVSVTTDGNTVTTVTFDPNTGETTTEDVTTIPVGDGFEITTDTTIIDSEGNIISENTETDVEFDLNGQITQPSGDTLESSFTNASGTTVFIWYPNILTDTVGQHLFQWSDNTETQSSFVPNANVLGQGWNNTINIANTINSTVTPGSYTGSSAYPAVVAASNASFNSQDDWYLPNQTELSMLFSAVNSMPNAEDVTISTYVSSGNILSEINYTKVWTSVSSSSGEAMQFQLQGANNSYPSSRTNDAPCFIVRKEYLSEPTTNLIIGQEYGGGIVFHIEYPHTAYLDALSDIVSDSSLQTVYIAADADIPLEDSSGFDWGQHGLDSIGDGGTLLYGDEATSNNQDSTSATAIGAGFNNTQYLLSVADLHTNMTSAFEAAVSLNETNAYTDWHLPSLMELRALHHAYHYNSYFRNTIGVIAGRFWASGYYSANSASGIEFDISAIEEGAVGPDNFYYTASIGSVKNNTAGTRAIGQVRPIRRVQTSDNTLSIGDVYGGGVIFYINNPLPAEDPPVQIIFLDENYGANIGANVEVSDTVVRSYTGYTLKRVYVVSEKNWGYNIGDTVYWHWKWDAGDPANLADLPGASSHSVGSGYLNTLDIQASSTTSMASTVLNNTAADGSYSEDAVENINKWHLPSTGEAVTLRNALISEAGYLNNLYNWHLFNPSTPEDRRISGRFLTSTETDANNTYHAVWKYGSDSELEGVQIPFSETGTPDSSLLPIYTKSDNAKTRLIRKVLAFEPIGSETLAVGGQAYEGTIFKIDTLADEVFDGWRIHIVAPSDAFNGDGPADFPTGDYQYPWGPSHIKHEISGYAGIGDSFGAVGEATGWQTTVNYAANNSEPDSWFPLWGGAGETLGSQPSAHFTSQSAFNVALRYYVWDALGTLKNIPVSERWKDGWHLPTIVDWGNIHEAYEAGNLAGADIVDTGKYWISSAKGHTLNEYGEGDEVATLLGNIEAHYIDLALDQVSGDGLAGQPANPADLHRVRPVRMINSSNPTGLSVGDFYEGGYIYKIEMIVRSGRSARTTRNTEPAYLSTAAFNKGNNYIAKGNIIGVNPLNIKFNNYNFKLPKGKYKYSLKSLTLQGKYYEQPSDYAQPYSGGETYSPMSVYLNCKTWLYGKLKITE